MPLQVSSVLPAWLAPGAPLTVRGFAGSQQLVFLHADGRLVGRARTGVLGGFVIHAVAPSLGAHRISLIAGLRRRVLGTLTVRPLVLAAVGDITPGEAVGPAIEANGSAYPWSSVGGLLQSADLTTANLEGAISSQGVAVPGKQYHFEGPLGLLLGARNDAGFDVMTLANNHVADFGLSALADTLKAAARAGIQTVGVGANATAARTPVFFDLGGLTVAFLGYSDVNPLGFAATATSPGTARAQVAAIDADVRAARVRADIVVCWFHWGVELQANPSSRQRMYAAAALAAGAQVVLGSHPHVFGPIEQPTGSTLVAWTLGNFVFPPSRGATSRTGILLVKLGQRGVLGYHVVPAVAGVRPLLAS